MSIEPVAESGLQQSAGSTAGDLAGKEKDRRRGVAGKDLNQWCHAIEIIWACPNLMFDDLNVFCLVILMRYW